MYPTNNVKSNQIMNCRPSSRPACRYTNLNFSHFLIPRLHYLSIYLSMYVCITKNTDITSQLLHTGFGKVINLPVKHVIKLTLLD